MITRKVVSVFFGIVLISSIGWAKTGSNKIVHDAEYYILEAQNGKKWTDDDKSVDKKLAEFRKKNGGKPPNLLYILIDDLGFGDMGIPELNAIRGYSTRRITPRKASFPCSRYRFVHGGR